MSEGDNIWAERDDWQHILAQPCDETLDVYIDLKSPHAYLAVRPSLEVARDFRVAVNFLPYTLSYEALGLTRSIESDMQRRPASPAADRKARMYYAAAREYAELQRLPFQSPRQLLDSSMAHKYFLFAKRQQKEVAFAMWVYLQGWGSGWQSFDLSSMTDLHLACEQAGVDLAGVDVFVAEGGEAEKELGNISSKAEAHGVVGVPHYVFTDHAKSRKQGLFGREHLALIRRKYLAAGLARHGGVGADFPTPGPVLHVSNAAVFVSVAVNKQPDGDGNMSELRGRVAAITGGSRGIGRGIAEALLAEGAKVAISGRTAAKGAQTLQELGADPSDAIFVAGDVRRQADVEAFVDAAVAAFGRLDVLINNAGGSSGFAPVAELADEAWQEALNWNLNATFWGTRRALPHMLSQRWGRIINISSVEGRQANKAAVSHYITNKHAINGFTKAVAFEYGEQGITANAICPGAVETDLMTDAGPAAAEAMGISYEEFLDQYAQEAAIKRLNTVEEVAAMAILLCRDVGGGINGAMLNVDGGTAL